MKKILQLLFFGHIHKWTIIQKGDLVDDFNDAIGRWYDCQCTSCGSIKRFTT